MHEGLEPKVVHRDIKSSNILLDRKWNAKVSDFGLAKLLGPESSYVTTRVMGTFGFVLPHIAKANSDTSKVYQVLRGFISVSTLYYLILSSSFCRYVSPEYASTGMLNEGSDVYSFGVLLMEIITGRSPIDYSRPAGEVNSSFLFLLQSISSISKLIHFTTV